MTPKHSLTDGADKFFWFAGDTPPDLQPAAVAACARQLLADHEEYASFTIAYEPVVSDDGNRWANGAILYGVRRA